MIQKKFIPYLEKKIRANSIIPVNKNKENENFGKIQETAALYL